MAQFTSLINGLGSVMRTNHPLLVALVLLTFSLAVIVPGGHTEPYPILVGKGILYTYENPERTIEVQKDPSENYGVLPSKTYYFNITGITEFDSTYILVLANYTADTSKYIVKVINRTYVESPPSNIGFNWTIPDLPITTSINFMYGPKADLNLDGAVSMVDLSLVSAHWYPGPPIGPLAYDPDYDIDGNGAINMLEVSTVSACWTGPPRGPSGSDWCYAKKAVAPNPRLLLVIPEVFLGSIGAIVALFSGVGIKKFARRKRTLNP